MDYHTKYNIKAFSLIELLIVLSIFTIFFSLSDTIFTSFKKSSSLDLTTNSVVQAMRHSQSNAEKNKGNSSWGIKFLSESVIIFKGNSYTNRDNNFDLDWFISKDTSITGVDEIVFNANTGFPQSLGIITITESSGSQKQITINEKGTITY